MNKFQKTTTLYTVVAFGLHHKNIYYGLFNLKKK